MKPLEIEKYLYKTEFHAHTHPASPCSEMSPAELVRAYREIGAHSVVITNHFTPEFFQTGTEQENLYRYMKDYEAAYEAGVKLQVHVILGLEVRFTENANDYLVYGVVPEDLPVVKSCLDKGIEHFYQVFKKEDNVIVQAHPFRNGMTLAHPDSLDGIEAFNLHPHHNSRVALSAQYAAQHRMLISGGTDFHHPGHQGMCLTCTKTLLKDSFDAARTIQTQDFLLDVWGNKVVPNRFLDID